MTRESLPLDEFTGIVRLFPLPNLVLFPHVAQPLHIFEPRYRQMMADALEDDRLLAIALLCPGWEEEYHKRPPIHSMVCVGQIYQEECLPDGRYTLMLRGLSRARIVEEITTEKQYRSARVELCPDEAIASPLREQTLRGELVQRIPPFFASQTKVIDQVRRLLESPLTLSALCDIFAYALPLSLEEKQGLLDTVCVEERVQALLHAMNQQKPPEAPSPPRRKFPPEFSAN